MTSPENRFSFGPFLVNATARTVFRGSERLAMNAKAFDALVFLLRHRGQVVSKEQLLAEVWGGVTVESNTLSQCISTLRRRLEDSSGEQRYIATIQGRGYSFVAPVELPQEDIPELIEPRRSHWWRWAVVALTTLTLSAGIWRYRSLERPVLPLVGELQLTHFTGENEQPSLSPDGQWLLFVSNRGGRGAIWKMRPDGRDLSQLTSGLQDDTPEWSPDGKWIAFQSKRSGGKTAIYIMNPDGSGQRRLTVEPSSRASWSPDGRSLAFQARRGAPHASIFTISLDGSNEQRISHPDVDCLDPSWSPDGSEILHTRLINGHLQLALMKRDGTGPRLLPQVRDADNRVPVWSKDGTRIAFVSKRDGKEHVYVMAYDGTDVLRLTGSQQDEGEPEWSADGLHIVFQRRFSGTSEVFVSALPPVQTDQLTQSRSREAHPTWSPDGKWIAFASNRDGATNIFRIDVKGGAWTDISRSSAEDVEPAWSPDGNRIAFTSNRSGHNKIHLMDADGGHARQVSSGGGIDSLPAWSPEGRQLVFSRWENSKVALHIINADGTGERPLTQAKGLGICAAWSVDGWIVFDNDRSGEYRLYRIRPDGSGEEELGVGSMPASSPDGKSIAFSGNEGHGWQIFVMGSEKRDIRRVSNALTQNADPAWSPDGKAIVIASNRTGNWELYRIRP